MRYFEQHGIKIPLNVPISGSIERTKIEDGMVTRYNNKLYFLQNKRSGSQPRDKRGYSASWIFYIKVGGQFSDGVKLNLKLKSDPYEIF